MHTGPAPSRRDQEDAELASQIQAVQKDSKGRHGAPRIHAELHHQGHRHGRKRVARLMRQAQIVGRAPKRWKRTTIPDPCRRRPGGPDPPGLHRRRY
jgi:transposase InsO family protein